MSTITSIKPQKNKKRVNIHLDGKFGFGLDLENFVKLNLRVEQELTEKEIEKIVKEGEFKKTVDKLLNFASLRPRSEMEIQTWLKRKKVHESIHKNLFNRLNRLNLLDDEKFAKWWISQRQEFKAKSKRELVFELKRKGINSEIIKETILEEKIDEEENAKKNLSKKAYKWERYEEKARKKKMFEYLARKGFEYDVVRKIVDDFLKQK